LHGDGEKRTCVRFVKSNQAESCFCYSQCRNRRARGGSSYYFEA